MSGRKAVKPPVEFEEKTRDGSPGIAGKEGRHLAMTGSSLGFSRAEAPGWVFPRCSTGSSGSLSCGAREVRSPMRVARGIASLLSSHGRGIGPQYALKKDSLGLSRVAAGNPRFQIQLDKRPLSPGTSREASGVPCLNPRPGLTLLSQLCRDLVIGV